MNLETKGSSYRSYYYLNIDYIFVPNVYICHKNLKIHEEIKLVLIVQGHQEAWCLMLAVAFCLHDPEQGSLALCT